MLLIHGEQLGLCVGNSDFVAQMPPSYSAASWPPAIQFGCGQTAVQGLKIAKPQGLSTYCDPSKPPSTKIIWNPKAVFSPRWYLSVQVHICSLSNQLIICDDRLQCSLSKVETYLTTLFAKEFMFIISSFSYLHFWLSDMLSCPWSSYFSSPLSAWRNSVKQKNSAKTPAGQWYN